MAANSKSSQA